MVQPTGSGWSVHHQSFADLDAVTGFQEVGLDPLSIDKGAVAAADISESRLTLIALNLGVMARGFGIVEVNVAERIATDPKHTIFQGNLGPSSRTSKDDESGHIQDRISGPSTQ
jgi:hypothetical protein